ncbi:MAG: rhomboid family intramembrane serine protease [Dysgonomonas sp.]
MKYLFVLIFIVVFILFGVDLGYTTSSPLYTHITYMFQHAGIIHLLINSLAFISMFRQVEKYVNKYLLSFLIILCAFASSFLAMYQIPTVGASSMVYAMLGIYLGLIAFCDKIKIADTRKFLLFIFCIVAILSASYFKHNSNFLVHICSLLIGFVVSIPISLSQKDKLSE